ncbi:hypothetical protein ACQJBY_073434 [Aegilops geniculata]
MGFDGDSIIIRCLKNDAQFFISLFSLICGAWFIVESPTKISSYQRNAQEKETITKYSPVQYKSILVAHADGRNKGKTLEKEFAIMMNKILIDLFFSSQAICGSHYRDLQMRGKGGEGAWGEEAEGRGNGASRALPLAGWMGDARDGGPSHFPNLDKRTETYLIWEAARRR